MDSMKVLNYICDNFNKYKNAYLLIRPPGHHSHDNHHEGFCIINNAYLLARNLIDKEKARKVLIFDWDLHHGNGTEKLIKENTKTIFILFQYMDMDWIFIQEPEQKYRPIF